MKPNRESAEERFRNRVAQLVGVCFFALLAFIGFGGIVSDGGRAAGLVMLISSALLVRRCFRSSDVLVDDVTVTTRSFLSTRRHALRDLKGVAVVRGRTGLNGGGREYLVLHRSDGSTVPFRELNSRPSDQQDRPSVVEQAAAAIRRRLPLPD